MQKVGDDSKMLALDLKKNVILGFEAFSIIVLVPRFGLPLSMLHVCIKMLVHFRVAVQVEQVETFATKVRHAWACTVKSTTASSLPGNSLLVIVDSVQLPGVDICPT